MFLIFLLFLIFTQIKGQNEDLPQTPCQRALLQEDSQQPSNLFVPEAPCDKPGSETLPVEELCSLPPDKGLGFDDVFRYYYNPVVQQCLPFSYSGKGGNANRFVSIKNCYEICHPADPTVKKPRVVSGIKAYLVPNLKSDCKQNKEREEKKRPKEVVIRQIPHPLDPTKTLTIIQNAQYVQPDAKQEQTIDANTRRLYQYESQPLYISPYQQSQYPPQYAPPAQPYPQQEPTYGQTYEEPNQGNEIMESNF